MANFMSQPPRGANPQALAQALMQMSEQPGDQINVRPAQWDPSQYSQALRGIAAPTASQLNPGKSNGQRAAGAAGGAISGAASGAMAGSVIPILGNGIGAIIGALAGATAGAM